MKRSILSLVTVLVLLVFALAPTEMVLAGSSWETGGFRTANGRLVRLGMTKSEVSRDAGEPLKGKSKSSKKKRETWTYKGNDGYYKVTFLGDQVAKIVVTPFRGR